MPNIWAHIQFGREALAERHPAEEDADHAWKRAFQLGCQGPDFLFYHHFFPWQPASPLYALGSQMHGVRCGPFLLDLLEQAGKRGTGHPAFAFAYGFLLHHVLDRNMHPYVFSRSGFGKWRHQSFETAMDSAIMHRRAGIHTGSIPVAQEIDTGGRLPGELTEAFYKLVQRHYPVWAGRITPDLIDEAVSDMVRAQRLFFDPSGWKGKLLFRQLQPFSPPRRLPGWDVLNDARKPWIDPCDRTVRHSESVDDLWEAALNDARLTAGAALDWQTAEASERADAAAFRAIFAERLGNVSYETGRTCGTASITYAEPVVVQ